jgi:hypothetical protein
MMLPTLGAMGDRWLVLGTAATIGAALVAAVAQAGPKEERFALAPNLPRVAAQASLARDALTVSVEGAPAGTRVGAAVARLACTGGGHDLGGAVADARGSARWAVGEPLPERVRDGRHVLALRVGDTTIACGPIPSARPAEKPVRQRHWGTWSFARHFVD